MKIVSQLYANTFADLAAGDVFEAFGGHTYLAMNPVTDIGGERTYNAVELVLGRPVGFSSTAQVTKLSAELHVLGPA